MKQQIDIHVYSPCPSLPFIAYMYTCAICLFLHLSPSPLSLSFSTSFLPFLSLTGRTRARDSAMSVMEWTSLSYRISMYLRPDPSTPGLSTAGLHCTPSGLSAGYDTVCVASWVSMYSQLAYNQLGFHVHGSGYWVIFNI